MDNNKFILGLLVYNQVLSKTIERERVREQLPPAVSCWYGDIFTCGQLFWGRDIIDTSCFAVYFSGPLITNSQEVKFYRHKFFPFISASSKENNPFGFVMETKMEFSYKQNNKVNLATKDKSVELYLFSYILENEYTNDTDINTDFVPALKKFVDKLIKRFDVLEVSSAWGGSVIHIVVIKNVRNIPSETQADFLRWVQGAKDECSFYPDLWTEGVACGNSPIKLAWVRNVVCLR